MSDLIMSKVFSSGVNDAAIVSTIGSNIFFRGKEKFYKNLYDGYCANIKSFADENNVKLSSVNRMLVGEDNIIDISRLNDDSMYISEDNVKIYKTKDQHVARISINGHNSRWMLLEKTFEYHDGLTCIANMDNYNIFNKTILPVYRDEILKIYNITDKDINIYLEWIDAKDVYHYKENVKLNVNIKDIKID